METPYYIDIGKICCTFKTQRKHIVIITIATENKKYIVENSGIPLKQIKQRKSFMFAASLFPTTAVADMISGITTVITDNIGVVLGVLAFSVGVGFVMRHFKKTTRHIG